MQRLQNIKKDQFLYFCTPASSLFPGRFAASLCSWPSSIFTSIAACWDITFVSAVSSAAGIFHAASWKMFVLIKGWILILGSTKRFIFFGNRIGLLMLMFNNSKYQYCDCQFRVMGISVVQSSCAFFKKTLRINENGRKPESPLILKCIYCLALRIQILWHICWKLVEKTSCKKIHTWVT